MPREAWRDDPEYLGLWRMARQQPDDTAGRFVLADWLEEHGHRDESWRERLHALTGSAATIDPDTGTARASQVPMGQGAWRRLLEAPPADDLLCVFDRDVQAYQYLAEYRGRCGWDVGQSDFSSVTERAHLMAVPRLELLACELVGAGDWDWLMDHLPGLLYFEATEPMIDAARLADLKRLPRLRGLVLNGKAAFDTTAVNSLPGLRHLAVGPFMFEASRLAALAPEVESLHADPVNISASVRWPRLRSLQMLDSGDDPLLGTREVKALARYPLLERLNIRCGKLKTTALEALAGLPRLRELSLRFADGSLPSLQALAKAPALESLTVEGPVSEEHLGEIVNINGLRVLSLSQVAVGKGLAALAEMPALEELTLHGESTGATGLTKVAALPHLAKLDLQFLKMPPQTARAVKAACPPWVECLVPDAPQE